MVVIGLEIHIELKTKGKMFCRCSNTCPICLAEPGVLPTINKEAVEKVIKLGLAVDCQISDFSFFERKSYFYPDLPKGFQISQYQAPLCKNGFFEGIRIHRIHLEEDTARLIHSKEGSLIDFSRAGIPLMEIVTEPDIKTGVQAKEFAKELQRICRYLDLSEADMEKGQMRVEVNISLQTNKSDSMGVKVEIKNLNSFKAIEKAIDYEMKRQKQILENGKKVIQETRGWNDVKQITFSQRSKEQAQDYRYFPEPDLLPFNPSDAFVFEKLKKSLAELPEQKRQRYKREYKLTQNQINSIIEEKERAEFFEESVQFVPGSAGLLANYFISDLFGLVQKYNLKFAALKFKPKDFAALINFLLEGKIQSPQAKMILEQMIKTGKTAQEIIKEKGIKKIEKQDLEKAVQKVLEENQKAIADFKKGKQSSFQYLIGQTMKKTKGKANPKDLGKILLKFLTK